MKAIVTGGAGFIGSHIAKGLLDIGHDVVVIDNLSAGKMNNVPEGAKFVHGWMEDPITYHRHLEGADVIFHNAASKKNICLNDPVKDAEVNTVGTLRLLGAAKHYGVKKFVHASTGSVYGEARGITTEDTCTNPVSYYGISKLAGEQYVRYFSRYINTTVLRYFHVYGARQEDADDLGGVVAIFKKKIEEGLTLQIYGDGEQERVFTYIDDIVDANIKAWKSKESNGKVYNCAGHQKVSINELIEMLSAEIGLAAEGEYNPPLEGDIRWFNIDSSAIREIGVRFRGFDEGLRTYINVSKATGE